MEPGPQANAESLFQQALALPQEKRKEFLAKACWDNESLHLELVNRLTRWQEQVESLFHRAAALPPEQLERFLAAECPDQDVCNEVRSLLPYHDPDDKFMKGSPFEPSPLLKPGDLIGQYAILALIGHGSMGDVYSARHPRLPGSVAVKVLARHLVRDLALIERFKSEAEIAHRLAHPHILKVLDIGQQGDVHYIVSEFVDGAPLREYIGRLSLPQALDYARQIGDALQTAHDAGIIHRDIKPENVMVLNGGKHIKVLDFGLAKLVRLPPSRLSVPGMVFGTLDYMSPEALRGETDPSVDIWSWSLVLYEMVAGRLPAQTTEARKRFSNNKDLNRWMTRALAPRKEDRHQSMQDSLQDLPAIASPSPWRKLRQSAAVFIFLFVAAFAYRLWIDREQVIVGVNSLTSGGNIKKAAKSPDGKYLAYAITASGGQTLLIEQIGHSPGRTLVPVGPVEYVGVTFAPDSQDIYYVLKQKGASALYRVSIQGESRLILHDVDTAVSFSPDGKQFAFLRGHPPPPPSKELFRYSVVLAAAARNSIAETQRELPLLPPPYLPFFYAPLWSPDGLSVLCGMWNNRGPGAQIVTIRAADGQILQQVSQPWFWMSKPVWLKDGRSLAMVAESPGESEAQLLQMSWPGGHTYPWSHEHAHYGDLSAFSDSQIVTVQTEYLTEIWIVPIKLRNKVTLPTDEPKKVDVRAQFSGLTWTQSGTIISRAKIDTLPDLWSINPFTLEKHRVTEDNFLERDPVASPDGKYLVYASDRGGTSNLWRSNPDGTGAIPLTSGSSVDAHPTITPDGQWVIYGSNANGTETLWIVSIHGEQHPFQLTRNPARNPEISPDGRKILCEYSVDPEQGWSTVTLDRNTGQLIDTFPEIPEKPQAHWSINGSEILYVVTNDDVSEIWAQRAKKDKIHGDNRRRLAHFTEDAIHGFAVSPDGRSIACIRVRQSSNAVLIETARWPQKHF